VFLSFFLLYTLLQKKEVRAGLMAIILRVRKTRNIFLFTLILIIILTSCTNNKINMDDTPKVKDYSQLPLIERQANSVIFYEVKGLSEASDLILIGTPEKPFEEREHVSTFYDDGNIMDFHTKTEIKVIKVLKNEENIQIGETIYVNEPVSIINQENELFKIRYSNYEELKEGIDYITFLKKNTEGSYSLIGENYGRFDISNKNIENENSKYEKLKTEVFDMYNINN
jgi:hypothetical protein